MIEGEEQPIEPPRVSRHQEVNTDGSRRCVAQPGGSSACSSPRPPSGPRPTLKRTPTHHPPRYHQGKLFLGGLDPTISKEDLDAYASDW
jgi:hypothetical protein